MFGRGSRYPFSCRTAFGKEDHWLHPGEFEHVFESTSKVLGNALAPLDDVRG